MKTRSLILFGLLLTASLCMPQLAPSGSAADTNAEPAVAAAPPTLVDISELQNLREKLDSIQHANDAAAGKWTALAEQNAALSKVLAELQDTLVSQQEALASQRKRETDLTQEARALNIKVMLGAAAGMFLVFLASYWFQLRCLNRVMELSRSTNALQTPFSHPLLENHNTADSKLLEVVRILENRIQLLEAPAKVSTHTATAGNGNGHASENGENGHATGNGIKVIEAAPEPQPAASKASLLLAKGEILLDMERFQDAATSFQEAVALEPTNAEAHLKKGIALERMNRLEHSLSAYDEAIRLNPTRAFAYVYKARVLAALHRHDEALSVYDAALGKNTPKTPPPSRRIYTALKKTGFSRDLVGRWALERSGRLNARWFDRWLIIWFTLHLFDFVHIIKAMRRMSLPLLFLMFIFLWPQAALTQELYWLRQNPGGYIVPQRTNITLTIEVPSSGVALIEKVVFFYEVYQPVIFFGDPDPHIPICTNATPPYSLTFTNLPGSYNHFLARIYFKNGDVLGFSNEFVVDPEDKLVATLSSNDTARISIFNEASFGMHSLQESTDLIHWEWSSFDIGSVTTITTNKMRFFRSLITFDDGWVY